MIIKQINRDDAAEIYVVGQNAAGETLSNGVFLCWDWRNASSHGNAVIKPTTSTLGLFAGVLAHKARIMPTFREIVRKNTGFRLHGSVAYNVGAASLSCAGQFLVPANAVYSGQSVVGIGTFTSNALICARGAFLLTNDLSGDGWSQAFVRSL